jgi:hypothetical protein
VTSFLYYNGRQNFNSLVVFPTPSRFRWALLLSAAPLLTSEGGIAFPRSTIDEVLEQTGHDLARFDLDLDLPEHFLAEFPRPIYLTTHGNVSQGKLVTSGNFYELFS